MREREHIPRRRTPARLVLPLALAAALAGTASAAAGAPKRIVFPVVGEARFTNDFGAPRGQGAHAGNDIVAAWKSPVVAVEPGTVRIYTRSARAGCMLYLHGRSGATYLYVHLNDDRGPENDNEGGCRRGVAYAPGLRDGQRVRAGQLVGYVGDSGDADGLGHHLHFELHPEGREPVSPFRVLRRAHRLLFAVPGGAGGLTTAAEELTLAFAATVVAVEPAAGAPDGETPGPDGSDAAAAAGAAPPPPPPPPPAERTPAASAAPALLTIRTARVRLSTGETWRLRRTLTLAVPAGAVLERAGGRPLRLGRLAPGDRVRVTTAPVEHTLAAQRGRPGALVAARVLLRG